MNSTIITARFSLCSSIEIDKLGKVTNVSRPSLRPRLSGPRLLGGEDNDAVPAYLCRHEFQGCLFAFTEEQLAATHEDRMDREPKLIKQVALQQRLPEKTMAVYDQVLAVLLLELDCLGHDIALDNRRVIPISALCRVDEKTYLRMLLSLSA